MPFYEHVLIARQDISSTQVDAITDSVAEIVKEGGGEVKKKENWGLRNLAYRIKKNRKGHYVLLNLDAPSAAVQEMERQLRLHEDVLRFLTLRVDELDEEPSVVMRNKGSRDDRGRGRDRDDRGRRDGPRDGGPRGGPRDRDDAPKADVPKADAPKADAPKADAAETEKPASADTEAKTETATEETKGDES